MEELDLSGINKRILLQYAQKFPVSVQRLIKS